MYTEIANVKKELLISITNDLKYLIYLSNSGSNKQMCDVMFQQVTVIRDCVTEGNS